MKSLNKDQDKRLQDGQSAIADLYDLLDEIASEAEGFYDEKSEKWQESDAGSSYSEWKESLRNAAEAVAEAKESVESLSSSVE